MLFSKVMYTPLKDPARPPTPQLKTTGQEQDEFQTVLMFYILKSYGKHPWGSVSPRLKTAGLYQGCKVGDVAAHKAG